MECARGVRAPSHGRVARHRRQRVELRVGDLLEPVTETPVLVVANPPYIAPGTELMPEVGVHEPDIALYGDEPDALGFHRRIVTRAATLGAGGVLLEIGYDQGEAAAGIEVEPWGAPEVHRDLAGHTRVVEWSA